MSMILSRLELFGFKSFADKTTVDFQSGLTAIVGPNGCGKSNIVDAIRWVLGEQRMKNMRAKDTTDVIFSGSEKRQPLSFCEVSLIFDNSTHILPIGFTEVTITRRLYRSGESEYLINKQPCRLRDVKELFLDTGIGVSSYSLIEQGKIDQLLNSSPADRRKIFEEAAGVSRYKVKRKQAQSRLERTEQNLLRLGDHLDEIRSRLRSVRRQAARALKYKEYNDELKSLRMANALYDYHKLVVALEETVKSLDAQKAEEQTKYSARHALEFRITELETNALDLGDRISKLSQVLSDTIQRLQAAEQKIKYNTARLEDTHREDDHLNRQEQELESLLQAHQERIQISESSLEEIHGRLTETERRIVAAAEEVSRAATLQERARTDLESRKNELMSCVNKRSSLNTDIGRIRGELDSSSRRATILRTRRAELETAIAGLKEQRIRAESETSSLQERLKVFQENLEKKAAERQALETDIGQKKERLGFLERKIAGKESRRETLAELEKRSEGLSGGVKKALDVVKSGGNSISGFVGLMADLIRCETTYAPAIEAALGQDLQTLVVETQRDAERLLFFLREQNASARVLALDTLRPAPGPLDFRTGPGVLRVLDKIQVDEARRPMAQRLLGKTLLVETLAEAWKGAEENPGCPIVAFSGERIDECGVVASPGTTKGGLLSRKSELREIAQELKGLTNDAELVRGELTELVRRDQALKEEHQALSITIRTVGDERSAKARELATLDRQHEFRSEEQQKSGEELGILEQRMAELSKRENEITPQLATLQDTHLKVQNEITRLAGEERTRESDLRRAEKNLTDLKVGAAGERERASGLRESIAQSEKAKSETLEMRRGIDEKRGLNLRRRDELTVETEQARKDLAELSLKRASLDEALNKETSSKEDVERNLKQSRDTERETLVEIQAFQERLNSLKLQESETKLRIENLTKRILDDYNIDLVEAHKTYDPHQELNYQGTDARIQELRDKLDNFGPVNHEAIEELDVLEEREVFLAAQFADLTSARNSLSAIIKKLDEICKGRFEETFQQVRENFQVIFRKLFGGGKADLILEMPVAPANQDGLLPTTPDAAEAAPADPKAADGQPAPARAKIFDPLEAGIDVVARPPGKEPKAISLLSGGEKAMTTIALIFALFKSRPSPFCILDEVDAPLDDSNIGRFITMLEDFLVSTQFLIITHNKNTMASAGCLYGVTQHERGVSRVISVKFEQIDTAPGVSESH